MVMPEGVPVSRSPIDGSPGEGTALLAALRDDIAATTQPEDPISFTSDLICALLDEIVALRRALAATEGT